MRAQRGGARGGRRAPAPSDSVPPAHEPPRPLSRPRRPRRAGVCAASRCALRRRRLLAALALGAAGCSVKGAENANLILGKQQFVAKCGSCHTLARANTKGIVGPNLDEAFRASLAEAHGRSEIRGVVEYQVRSPTPKA